MGELGATFLPETVFVAPHKMEADEVWVGLAPGGGLGATLLPETVFVAPLKWWPVRFGLRPAPNELESVNLLCNEQG